MYSKLIAKYVDTDGTPMEQSEIYVSKLPRLEISLLSKSFVAQKLPSLEKMK